MDTEEAIREAIQAHVNATSDGPALLTDYYVIAVSVGLEDDTEHYMHHSSNMPLHTSYGLLKMASRRLEREQ
jgi:hypothetical protein